MAKKKGQLISQRQGQPQKIMTAKMKSPKCLDDHLNMEKQVTAGTKQILNKTSNRQKLI
jgi:hypothetical protein